MKQLWILIACVLALVAQAASDILSPARFTEEFKVALAAAMPGHSVEIVEPLQLRLQKTDTQEEARAYLDNAYNEYSRAPANKDQVIARYVTSLSQTAKSPEPVNPEQIVPVIKTRGWLQDMRRATPGPKKAEQVVEDLNKDLVIVYAEDNPQNIRYFSPQDLEKAGVKRDKLRALAVANLRRMLPPTDTARSPLVSMLVSDQSYVTSLLLLEEVWDAEKLGVEGEIVIAIPTRGALLYTGSKNKEGVEKLRAIAKQAAADGPYSLTDRLFVYRGGKFERF